MRIIRFNGIKVKFTNQCTTIYECYKLKDINNFILNIMDLRYRLGYSINRSIDSYIKETKAHKRLYKLGLFRSHTKDCDLEENQLKELKLIYKIIGR